MLPESVQLKLLLIKSFLSVFVIFLCLIVNLPTAYALTSPSLGLASTFGILSSTYTNTVGGTVINGDLGYTVGPATAPTVNGVTHVADSTYTQAGTDQNTALSDLASKSCTFNFAPGAIDLATDSTHGTVGVYPPGIYCITGNASIGGGGTITLTGAGIYIFRMTGSFNTSNNSIVALSGALACDVWWTPGAATTIGASSTFVGNDIDASGITTGNSVNWTGRALGFGGTVSTSLDSITVPTCSTPTPTATPTSNTSTSTSNSNSSSPSNNSPELNPFNSIVPTIIESKRVDANSVFFSWSPFSGLDTFNIQYSTVNGNWLYNTDVRGFSTTLKNLPSNQPIWVRIANRNSTTIGIYGEPKLIGGPILPRAGFAPEPDYTYGYIILGILLGTLLFTILIQRKLRFLSL